MKPQTEVAGTELPPILLIQGRRLQALTSKLIVTGLEPLTVSEPHVEVAWASPVRFMWLAQTARGYAGTFSLVMHVNLRHRPVGPDGARACVEDWKGIGS